MRCRMFFFLKIIWFGWGMWKLLGLHKKKRVIWHWIGISLANFIGVLKIVFNSLFNRKKFKRFVWADSASFQYFQRIIDFRKGGASELLCECHVNNYNLVSSADFINLYRFIVGVIAYTRERAFYRLKVDANDATFVWTNQCFFFSKRSDKEYRESRGNREGDGIRAAGAGRDRAGTLPAEGYEMSNHMWCN